MSNLKKVYVASDAGDAHLLRGLLETVGIRPVIPGDDFMPAPDRGRPPSPFLGVSPD